MPAVSLNFSGKAYKPSLSLKSKVCHLTSSYVVGRTSSPIEFIRISSLSRQRCENVKFSASRNGILPSILSILWASLISLPSKIYSSEKLYIPSCGTVTSQSTVARLLSKYIQSLLSCFSNFIFCEFKSVTETALFSDSVSEEFP